MHKEAMLASQFICECCNVLRPVHTQHIELQVKLISKDLLTLLEVQSTSKMVRCQNLPDYMVRLYHPTKKINVALLLALVGLFKRSSVDRPLLLLAGPGSPIIHSTFQSHGQGRT